MTARTLTLADFLLARIAEDEERARFVAAQIEGNNWAPFESWMLSWHDEYDLLCIEPSRALAECEAKRRIVEDIHHRQGGDRWDADACEGCGRGGPCDDYHVEHVNDCPTLRALALPFADHPDYNPDWRP